LIAYGQVWRTGANEATTISFSTDVTIEGQKLAAGSYSLHTIPSKTEWTIILNRATNQWGSFEYDAIRDALRVRVVPRAAEHQEWLLFSFPMATQNEAEMAIHWEKVKVVLRIEADTVGQALANIRMAIAAAKPDDWQVRYRSAEYAYENDAAPAEALAWIDQSIAIQAVYENLALKARMLAKRGETSEAIELAQRALDAARRSDRRIDSSAIETLLTQLKAGNDR
jgi:tetratricopeptide (TPR) repeat protein